MVCIKKNRVIKQTIEFYIISIAILPGVLLTLIMIISSFVSFPEGLNGYFGAGACFDR